MKLPSKHSDKEIPERLSQIQGVLEDMDKFFTRALIAILCVWLTAALVLIYHFITHHT